MKLNEYARHDALGLAALVATRQVSPRELALTAARAIEAANGRVNAVVETYPDRIESLDEQSLGSGPFRGVPFLIKDVFGHEKGRKIEFGSRLCQGMVGEHDTHYAELCRASGLNILGRTNAPEYSMAGTTENALYGNTSTPWKHGYSAGGSTGGGMAAVASGMVPVAHGSDIGGSIRIPASLCGGVGLKPSRGRISAGPTVDEGGFGMSMNFVQTMTVRDAAAMLDCLAIPQPGDPFLIPKPAEPYATLALKAPAKLKIGWSAKPLVGVPVDPEVAKAVEATAKWLAAQGHHVTEESPQYNGAAMMEVANDLFFFAFDQRLNGYAKRSGHTPGPDTLEPVIWQLYEYAKSITPARFLTALAVMNMARRQLGQFFTQYDIWLSPTTANVAEPWGRYNLGRTDVTLASMGRDILNVPTQFTFPHNIMGTPAISLPLAMHSSGLPVGVQLGAGPAQEHVLLQLATMLEQAMPWRGRTPPLHVSNM